eukprot:CAMPEP_0198198490 /NCGR_PEP_ID=MMETSP1445-20131203/1970_1 /TAXON_ID=36898 /ORGANISM="Pyramimonas sp., Strain CCMP2087" /LENGTH=46 /DNA_ID= /DNA_START= /DNA_END= /DNA_ORIENTATION=
MGSGRPLQGDDDDDDDDDDDNKPIGPTWAVGALMSIITSGQTRTET